MRKFQKFNLLKGRGGDSEDNCVLRDVRAPWRGRNSSFSPYGEFAEVSEANAPARTCSGGGEANSRGEGVKRERE